MSMAATVIGNGVSYQKNKWGCREVAPGSFRAIERDGYTVVLESNFADKDIVRESGARWRPERKRWVISIDRLPKLLGKIPNAEIDSEIYQLVNGTNEALNASIATSSEIAVPAPEGLSYLPYQLAGIQYVDWHNGVALMGDEMGLGKTIQFLGYANLHPEMRPILIVCPASLKRNWANETEKWLFGANVQILKSSREIQPFKNVVIINYDILRSRLDELLEHKFQLVCFDEAHYLKNKSAIRTKAGLTLMKSVPHKILLTGTPILNRPMEIFPLANALCPAVFPNEFQFGLRYAGGHKDTIYLRGQHGNTREVWNFDGASNLAELNERLRSNCMVRRLKKDVLKDLPPKRRILVPLESSDSGVVKLYQDAEKAQAKAKAKAEKIKAKIAAVVDDDEKAKLIAELDNFLSRSVEAFFTEIVKLRKQAALAKLDHALEIFADAAQQGKIVIFAHHHEVVDKLTEGLKERGFGVVALTGETPPDLRQGIIDRFQKDDKIQVFIGSLHAASQGITLTAASNVYFLEIDWTPAICMQAEDRCHRIGQKDSVSCYYLLLADTVEVNIAIKLENKLAVIEAAISGCDLDEVGFLKEMFDD